MAKLEAVRSVIWNTMISLAVSGIEMDENGLKALLDKQAGDSLALMEMEKVATALKIWQVGPGHAGYSSEALQVAPEWGGRQPDQL